MKICRGCFEEYNEKLDMCPYCGFDEEDSLKESIHLLPGYELKENYVIGKVLGFGGFGVTYLAYNKKLKTKVAIKEYLPSEFSTRAPGSTNVIVYKGDKEEQFSDGAKKFVDEANRLAKFRDTEGVVQIFESFEENGTAYIVMEYLIGETLTKYLLKRDKIPAEEAIALIMPIIKSLKEIHKENIIHRDIAPDNIILTEDGKVKLIDFGAARFSTASHSRSLTVLVKAGYSPEEQYRSRGDQGPWTDVYALCAVLYKMITGVRPPDALERRAFFEGKKKDILEPISKYSQEITDNEENAILNGMNVQIQDRSKDMELLEYELTTDDEVKRRFGTIKKIDILKWPLWAKIGAPIVLAGLITLIVLFATGVLAFRSNMDTVDNVPEGMAKVPSIIGETNEVATEMIENAITDNDEKGNDGINLVPVVSGLKFDETVPQDMVVDQLVNAGTMLPLNSSVEYIISAGTKKDFIQELMKEYDGQYKIPYLIGIDGVEAQKYLGVEYQQMNVLPVIEMNSSNYAKGVVMGVEPPVGTLLAPGSDVTLTVSNGPEPIDMPNVKGLSIKKAKSILMKIGIPVKVTYRQDSGDKDIVLEQDPPTGVKNVTPGEPATLTVSTKETTYSVPELGGLTEKQAEDKIKAAGFKVGKNNDAYANKVAKGKVISFSPTVGTELIKGATITITVSKGEQVNIYYDANGGSGVAKKQEGIAEDGMKIGDAPSKPLKYKVSFNADGGSAISAINIEAKFISWGEYKPGDNYKGREDLKLVAKWGTVKMPSLPTPTKKYNDFKGWYTAPTGGTKVSAGITVDSNRTLYARWKEHELSKWVKKDKVPSGAGIFFYRYDVEKSSLNKPANSTCIGVEWGKTQTKSADSKLKTKWTKYAINGKKQRVQWSDYVKSEYTYYRYIMPNGQCYKSFQDGAKQETKTTTKKAKEGQEGDSNVWFFSGESHEVYKWTIKKVKNYVFEVHVSETDKKPPSNARNIEVRYREA
ncbi:MAG: PASTA domain-containing protein [Prevotella sp.]|jgi:uncharacterized repeat protein (TIGR02543 family)|nr:PASTA domain-containing protein [Prevotella sp.]